MADPDVTNRLKEILGTFQKAMKGIGEAVVGFVKDRTDAYLDKVAPAHPPGTAGSTFAPGMEEVLDWIRKMPLKGDVGPGAPMNLAPGTQVVPSGSRGSLTQIATQSKSDDEQQADRLKALQAAAAGGKAMGSSTVMDASATAMTAARAAAGDPTAIAQLVGDAAARVGKLGESLGTLGRSVLKEQKADEMLTGVGESLAQWIEGGLGPLGKPLGDFAKALFGSVESIRKWGDEVFAGHMKFAEWSAAMTSVQVESMYRNIHLERERGDRRADDAREVAESRDRLTAAMAPMEDFFASIRSKISSLLSNATAAVFEKVNEVTGLDRANDPAERSRREIENSERIRIEDGLGGGAGTVFHNLTLSDTAYFYGAGAWSATYGRAHFLPPP